MTDTNDRDSKTSSSSLDSDVLSRAKAGDDTAYHTIVNLYGGLVYTWCRNWSLAPADAAEVAQEVFVSVWKGIDGFRRDNPQDSFRGWLRTITRNRTIDYWHSIQRQPLVIPPDDQLASPETTSDTANLLRSETRILAFRALQTIRTEFSDRDAMIFEELVMRSAAPKDLAARFELKVGVIHVVKSRILKRLRDEFGVLIEGDV